MGVLGVQHDGTRAHVFRADVEWTGDRGAGTASYRAYDRAHLIGAPGKPTIPGSSDPAFRGDPARWNPEELLVASLSACHMLWHLHLCAEAGIVVTAYADDAEGEMARDADRLSRVTLRPRVTVAAGSDPAHAQRLHEEAHRRCFIANSVSFPVGCEPVCVIG
jgi:organic hydroperoxide reductase OsmC/OhrA